jgi:hypothetical protein
MVVAVEEDPEEFLMHTKKIQFSNRLQIHRSNRGQAIAEFTICLIALTVLFLGILLFGDLCRARMLTLVDSRKDAGADAMAGVSAGAPSYYGTADAADRLQSEVLSAAETPIAYSQFKKPAYPYIKNNFSSPLYDSATPLVSSMNFTQVEKTLYVTNSEGLVNLKVGRRIIPITQKTTMPLLEGF